MTDERKFPMPSTIRHVAALGSSFASGPGIEPVADKAASRSARNYPHLIAQRLGADLTDLTVAGATTDTILHHPQRILLQRFPPQLSGLPTDADLVTVTAGGNDLGYIGTMIALAYRHWLIRRRFSWPIGKFLARNGVPTPGAAALEQAATNLVAIVDAVRRHAPDARVVLVDYFTVLDADTPTSTEAPFTPAERKAFRALARALDAVFVNAAQRSGAELVTVSRLSTAHGLGSTEPWIRGFDPRHPGWSFHPTFDGMSAVADAVIELLEG
ncbi:SGNH/GDSL hydrolase family protein [Gordonia sp. CPCC 205515]|uniref:SGNH/GDSL hydrolase family protein n=1 Tax=Gordonia sp. CPCC 205515 TaxID=3140791 RepID=UPI003AF3F6FF